VLTEAEQLTDLTLVQYPIEIQHAHQLGLEARHVPVVAFGVAAHGHCLNSTRSQRFPHFGGINGREITRGLFQGLQTFIATMTAGVVHGLFPEFADFR
jgi:hypothetical protein